KTELPKWKFSRQSLQSRFPKLHRPHFLFRTGIPKQHDSPFRFRREIPKQHETIFCLGAKFRSYSVPLIWKESISETTLDLFSVRERILNNIGALFDFGRKFRSCRAPLF